MTNTLASKLATRNSHDETGKIGLNERLSLISLIDEGARSGSSETPVVADMFSGIWNLVDATVRGAKIDRLQSDDSSRGFKVFEINSETGENLGRLNLLYLKKPIPCYYLVYVEVAPAFRNKGLGNLILKAFREFLIEKSAVGILDNIIPKDDPTYDIYLKLNWHPMEEISPTAGSNGQEVYMVFIPPAMEGRDLKDPLVKLLHHLKRKRAAIDMRDNELMVKRTIDEFKDLYAALLVYFDAEIRTGQHDSLMRYIFTRYVTKLLGFRRRIGQLLGFTGGESLEQIVLEPAIRSMPVQSYAPRDMAGKPSFEFGDTELWLNLPETVKKYPARMVEALPNYRRPSLVTWMEATGSSSSDTLTIGDLLDLGFDPTRLKEVSFEGEEFIFERVQARLLPSVQAKAKLLERITPQLNGTRVRNALVQSNPPLLIIRDRGNGYVLRRKVAGIHWEEALEQLQTVPRLQELSRSMRLDRLILGTIRQTVDLVSASITREEQSLLDDLTYFVSWDLDGNHPKVAVDFSGSFLESVWIA